MSASFYDLMKFAKTGIASPEMTGYDKMKALAFFGGSTEQTLTGIPPLTFKADGTPLISWSMKGNGQQTGTPSPDNIIMPTFCGVRTANLFDKNATDTNNGYVGGSFLVSSGSTTSSSAYFVSEYIPVSAGESYTLMYGNGTLNSPSFCLYNANKEYISGNRYGNQNPVSFTVPDGVSFMRFSAANNAKDIIMLNSGSTALPYEPYGYKIPITCAGQTTPLYLGEVSTVRRIKKLVLTGEETFVKASTQTVSRLRTSFTQKAMANNTTLLFCSHYFANAGARDGAVTLSSDGGTIYFSDNVHATDADTFKQYLRDEYSAGHPVVVWYVLATEQTGIVNEPLAKIGDYADELHSTDAGVTIPTAKGQNTLTVETDLQPSEMTVTYGGRHSKKFVIY